MVPHRGTNWAALWLTAQIGRDAVLSESYGRGYPLCLMYGYKPNCQPTFSKVSVTERPLLLSAWVQTSKGRSIETPHRADPHFPASAPAEAGGLRLGQHNSNGFVVYHKEECDRSALGEYSLAGGH